MLKGILSSLHKPAKSSHKGQNGKLLIIGGGAKYSGSPLFEILAARRFVDLLYFYPGETDPFLIQAAKNIPETIVKYRLDNLSQMDCVLFGSGMDGADFDIYDLLEDARKIVVDADGFNFVEPSMLDKRFILTPHKLEFERYFGMEATEKNVIAMAKLYKCVILRKGTPDVITDGKRVYRNDVHNAGMTKGGTGDVLAGLTAALACTNPNFEAAVAAAYINGLAGNMLMKEYGYNYCASDLADKLAEVHFKATKR